MNLGPLVPVNNMLTILICVPNSLRSSFDIENQPYLQNAETFLEFLFPVTLFHVNELLLFYKKTK